MDVFARALAIVAVAASPALAQSVESDDFNGCGILRPFWSTIDPLGDTDIRLVGGGTADAFLEFDIPGGTAHHPWGENTAPRLMQATSDDDFSLEAKFESLPTLRFQEQGFIVEQDPANWIRFDVYSRGNGVRLFAGVTTNGSSSVRYDRQIAVSGQVFLRVTRTGDLWQLEYSQEGTSWKPGAVFLHPIGVTSVGVYAGNARPSPPFLSRVDYFEVATDPLLVEDGGPVGPFDVNVTTSGTGAGNVVLDPPVGPYACGQQVTATAVSAPGSQFTGWGGDVSGNDAAVSFVVSDEIDIQASFGPDSPPVITNVVAASGSLSALVTWTTDEPATSAVEFGVGGAFDRIEQSTELVREHAILLSGLTPDTVYDARVTSVDSAGAPVTSAPITFATLAASSFLSDSFNGCGPLSSLWTVNDPLADSTIALVAGGSENAGLQIDVAGGTPHVPWGTFNAPHVTQPCADDPTLSVTAKLLTLPVAKFQMQGIVIEEDAGNWLRCEFYSTGSKLICFMASTEGGSSNSVFQRTVTLSAPAYLRVDRNGDDWTQLYSDNGTDWITLGTYARPMSVARVGVFAANAGASPAYSALFDYIESDLDPLFVEDADAVGPFAVTTVESGTGTGTIVLDPPGPYTCGQVVTATAVPSVGSQFAGWSGALQGLANPAEFPVFGSETVGATFGPDVPPTIDDISVSAALEQVTIRWTTDEPATSLVEYGSTPALGLSVGSSTLTRTHEVVIPGLEEASQYFYELTSEDVGGLSSTVSNLSFWTATPLTDDFNRSNLGQDWEVIDPIGVGLLRLEGASSADAQLVLETPAGTPYGTWYSNEGLQVRRPLESSDFDVAVSIQSDLGQKFQSQGFLFETADGEGFARVEYYHDESSLRVFAAVNEDSSPDAYFDTPVLSGAVTANDRLYLRVAHAGSSWSVYTAPSFDPAAPLDGWELRGSFTDPIEVATVGLYVGSDGQSPGIVGRFDWFADLSDPPLGEDTLTEPDVFGPLQYSVVAGAPQVRNISFSWKTDEPAFGEVRFGLDPSTGSSFAASGLAYQHGLTVTGLLPNTTYYFRVVSRDDLGQESESSLMQLTTLDGSPPIFEIRNATPLADGSGLEVRFGDKGQPQRWANILGNVFDADGTILPNSLYYTLNGGPRIDLTLGPDPFRLINPGDFNVDVDIDTLQVGENVVEIHATDNAGLEQIQRVVLNFDDASYWPFESIDFTQDSLLQSAQVVDGRWYSTPEG
ncbi:MAG: DUF1349 domain-containing protein, partial [Planctomycetota bacterium]